MNFYDSGDILTGDMIAQFENDLNLSLPSDYKSFMLKVNGGTPEDDWMFSFVDSANGELNNSDLRELFVFYNEVNDNYDDIIRIYKSMVSEKLISPLYFPIGDDSGGNPICINLSDDEYGAVFYCDHELENAETGFLLSSKIANSFEDFLELLCPLE